ncbi:MAG: EMC3/TMCO1 family protein [Candidatus Thermoplasmatota archaeon]|jgi:uncharacterized membrane protein (DUF106 family)|nr:EMC3/TMCO1 family protein [Candidatus Thermoplasmatota archaeon]
MDDRAQGSTFLYMMMFLLVMFVMMSFGQVLGYYFGLVLQPVIGFDGNCPLLTIFLAGLIVVFLSSLLTNLLTDWRKMAHSQEISKAFQKEMASASKNRDMNKIAKLRKIQPEIMRRQTEASSGSMKSMVFLAIFIWPIFIWLQNFLRGLPYFYFTVPWANQVSFFSYPVLWQAWLWIYLITSMLFGHIIRQGLKWISLSDWWRNIRRKTKPSAM